MSQSSKIELTKELIRSLLHETRKSAVTPAQLAGIYKRIIDIVDEDAEERTLAVTEAKDAAKEAKEALDRFMETKGDLDKTLESLEMDIIGIQTSKFCEGQFSNGSEDLHVSMSDEAAKTMFDRFSSMSGHTDRMCIAGLVLTYYKAVSGKRLVFTLFSGAASFRVVKDNSGEMTGVSSGPVFFSYEGRNYKATIVFSGNNGETFTNIGVNYQDCTADINEELEPVKKDITDLKTFKDASNPMLTVDIGINGQDFDGSESRYFGSDLDLAEPKYLLDSMENTADCIVAPVDLRVGQKEIAKFPAVFTRSIEEGSSYMFVTGYALFEYKEKIWKFNFNACPENADADFSLTIVSSLQESAKEKKVRLKFNESCPNGMKWNDSRKKWLQFETSQSEETLYRNLMTIEKGSEDYRVFRLELSTGDTDTTRVFAGAAIFRLIRKSSGDIEATCRMEKRADGRIYSLECTFVGNEKYDGEFPDDPARRFHVRKITIFAIPELPGHKDGPVLIQRGMIPLFAKCNVPYRNTGWIKLKVRRNMLKDDFSFLGRWNLQGIFPHLISGIQPESLNSCLPGNASRNGEVAVVCQSSQNYDVSLSFDPETKFLTVSSPHLPDLPYIRIYIGETTGGIIMRENDGKIRLRDRNAGYLDPDIPAPIIKLDATGSRYISNIGGVFKIAGAHGTTVIDRIELQRKRNRKYIRSFDGTVRHKSCWTKCRKESVAKIGVFRIRYRLGRKRVSPWTVFTLNHHAANSISIL